MYKVTVMGLGFVGLTTALAFAEKNHQVYGFETNAERRAIIESGQLPFYEPGLDTALKRHLNQNFRVAGNIREAVEDSDFIFLCVGTPSRENGEADLTYIYSAVDMILPFMKDDKYRVVVVKSTIPPSTTSERIIPYVKSKGYEPGRYFSVANNPEFLREGKSWEDALHPDRIVCGVADRQAEVMLKKLYEKFSAPFFAVTLNTGEFIKYLSNTLLATMISYSNEMSMIADKIGDIQIKEAFQILHMDRRWGGGNMSSYVYPGCGYGGYCLPKDTKAMHAISKAKGCESQILDRVIRINEQMPRYMANKVMALAKPEDKIGILGLSFKPGSDDVRDSSSAKIISVLQEAGFTNLFVYDPMANETFAREYAFKHLEYCDHLDKICDIADVLVLVTAWEEFKGLNRKYPDKKIVDCRYFL